MESKAKVYPRYMALNSGQEAFQLFYERLLGLKEQQQKALASGNSFYKQNQYHLATIVHTFNRHYCTEIGSDNPFYRLSGVITPVFLNLGLYREPEYNLHRLLGIRLVCSSDNPRDHTFNLYFDHAAFGYEDDDNNDDNAIIMKRSAHLDKSMQKYTLSISIEDFTNNHYNEQIYQYTPEDNPYLDLVYNTESRNFSYENYFDKTEHGDVTTIDSPVEMPPLFGRLFSTGVVDGVMQCTDYRRFYYLLGTHPQSKNSYWTVRSEYVAWNRYTGPPPVKPEFIQSPAIDDTSNMRILTLLCGCNSMLYVNENFNTLWYEPKPSITYGLAGYDNTNSNLTSLLITAVGNIIPRTETPLVDPGLYDDGNTDTEGYIELYHRYNNYLNCVDTTIESVKRLYDEKSVLIPTYQKSMLMKSIDTKLVKVDTKEGLTTWTVEKSLFDSTTHDLKRYIAKQERYLVQMTKVLANFNKDMTKSF